jgi:hypothetical protein
VGSTLPDVHVVVLVGSTLPEVHVVVLVGTRVGYALAEEEEEVHVVDLA